MELGLILNSDKCEVISNLAPTALPTSLAVLKQVEGDMGMLLGSPLSSNGALQVALEARVQCLEVASSRLRLLHCHDALLILKNSMSIPSLHHILMSAPCSGHPLLESFDDTLRQYLESVLNVKMRAVQLAPSAFLASAAASLPLVSVMLSLPGDGSIDLRLDSSLRA